MSEFRDAIAVTGSQPYSMTPCDADAILAMPEMQAIRTFILDAIPNDLSPMTDETIAAWLRGQGLTQSVIEWVVVEP